ncbi:unnamed protein product [Bursaphelenchus xylophilus]|uniref:(pine wood nematode) hypothetical protein n=1 Tax=Bursaphelenchus xylophilus TaxID=6326 RepID=A0A7I8WI99_BURXY|nr:unnamed protein product [Bursaphelenchus xylophilus]CAG9109122.1 unnamed protein product [Bursaphelenchus xylophilus]
MLKNWRLSLGFWQILTCFGASQLVPDPFPKAPVFTLPPLPEFHPKLFHLSKENDENRVLPRFSSGPSSYTYFTNVQTRQKDEPRETDEIADHFPKTVMSMNNGRLVKVERVSGSMCGIEDSYMIDPSDVNTAICVIQKLNFTKTEVRQISEYANVIDLSSVLDLVYAHVFKLDDETRSRALQLLQDYGPPESLIRAVQAMTMDQKGHIQELRHKRRVGEVRVITRGLIFSLPDEDQPQARKFVAILRYMFDYDRILT